MAHSIRTVYVVHHSHTDIGYTDLQERVVYNQVDYIRTVLGLTAPPNPSGFRWNCEPLFCVRRPSFFCAGRWYGCWYRIPPPNWAWSPIVRRALSPRRLKL